MTKRSAPDFDFTLDSDSSSAQGSEPDTVPDPWMTKTLTLIIGAYLWCNWGAIWVTPMRLDWYGEQLLDKAISWGQPIVSSLHFKFLLQPGDIMPLPTTPGHVLQFQQWWRTLTSDSLLSVFSATQLPSWTPREDYAYLFMRWMKNQLDTSLLAVADLRWVACRGILVMDSKRNITACDFRPVHERASRVQSIPPTDESVHAFKQSTTTLLNCLNEWNITILPAELQKRRGGVPGRICDRQFPIVLLQVLVEYIVPPCLQLVFSSTCNVLQTRSRFGSTRRVGISLDTVVCDILYAFLTVDECDFTLTATDAQGVVHDFSDESCLRARDLPVSWDNEIHLQVQTKPPQHWVAMPPVVP